MAMCVDEIQRIKTCHKHLGYSTSDYKRYIEDRVQTCTKKLMVLYETFWKIGK